MDIYTELIRYAFHPGDSKIHRIKDFMTNFMLGGVSAALAKTIFAPVERAKLLLQLQEVKSIDPSKRYKGAIDCLIRIPREEGIYGYWRGNFTNVIRYFPTQALSFAFRDVYKKLWVRGIDRRTEFRKHFWANVAAGAAAGGSALVFVFPLDFVRTRLSLDMGKPEEREYKNLRDCIRKIYKSDGFFGFYRGFLMSVYGIVIFRGTSFGLYDVGRAHLHPTQDTVWMSIALAQFSTVTASFISYPLDTVSRRMMMQSGLEPEKRHYKSTLHCYMTMFKEEGIRAFFKGCLVNTFRCTGAALVLVMYEEAKRLLEPPK